MSSTASIAKSSFFVSRIMSSRPPSPQGHIRFSRVSRRRPVRTSGLDARRSETAFLAASAGGKRRYDRELRSRDAGEDELGDAVAGPNRYRLTVGVAVPRRYQAGSLIIGVDDSDRIAEDEPLLMAETGARQDHRTPSRVADAKSDAGGDQDGRHLRLEEERAIDAGMQVEPRRQARAPGREAPAGQPWIEDLELDFHELREALK